MTHAMFWMSHDKAMLFIVLLELFVWEDDVTRTIRFTNARKDGFMSKFDGTWQVQPFSQQTLDSIYKGAAATAAHPARHGHNWLSGEFIDCCCNTSRTQVCVQLLQPA